MSGGFTWTENVERRENDYAVDLYYTSITLRCISRNAKCGWSKEKAPPHLLRQGQIIFKQN